MTITITLLSHSDYRKEISHEAVKFSALMVGLLGDENPAGETELPLHLEPAVCDRVVEFLEHHVGNPLREIKKPIRTNVLAEMVDEWDARYMDVDNELLVSLIKAANYLDCASLLELVTCKMACMVLNKDSDEVRAIFGITHVVTPEEDKQIRQNNPWLFDDEPAVAVARAGE